MSNPREELITAALAVLALAAYYILNFGSMG
jgi:hypothetical protein